MTEFIASNGIQVGAGHTFARFDDGGENTIFYIGIENMVALKDLFRHEEDERLSRWRSKVDPDIVGYAVDDASIRLVDEATHGNTSMFYRTDPDGLGPLSKAAREYFDAHPEPKPWDSAEPGEYWALTVGGDEGLFKLTVDGWKHEGKARHPLASWKGSITAGRRIWPEDAS